jgi:hypothetical protein
VLQFWSLGAHVADALNPAHGRSSRFDGHELALTLLSVPPIDRRTLLKIAGAASLATPGLNLLQGLTGNGAVAEAATGAGDTAPATAAAATVTLGGADVRPPSIPLAVRSPYLSTWLPATELTSATPQFWNGATRGFVGLVRIDSDLFAWAGQPTVNGNAVTPLTPVSTEVTATRSIFTAQGAGVQLVAEWLSPVEPGNLQLQSAPLTLLTVSVSFTDGSTHDVQLYADITGEWASSDENAQITWQTTSDMAGRYWAINLKSPTQLQETNQMANWGTVVWAAPAGPALTYASGASDTVRGAFGTSASGELPDTSATPPATIDGNPPTAFAFAVDLGTSPGSTSFVLGHVRTPLISYGQPATQLMPLWTQYWSSWQQMTAAFLVGSPSARQRAIGLDTEVEEAATAAGGSGYAAACALALRQCYGGTELAIGPDGSSTWLLGKEISSDGDTNTVDIFDQAFLAWLWLDPDLIPLVMAPILDWCNSPAWQNASAWSGIPSWEDGQNRYCVHDLGVYPTASGRVPGNGEQMPIEESAGMLIMAAAYANKVGASAAAPFLEQWQALWAQWANYLMTQVPTPAAQLTTDDWAPGYATETGAVNLGIKAIIGLAAAGQIATIVGDTANAAIWSNAATTNVEPWVTLSTDASAGNYLNLEQGATNTWSSLYNAYYETVIGVSLVPEEVAADQANLYLSKLTTYGMPLQTDANDLNKVAWQFYLAAWLASYPLAGELLSRNVDYINDTPSLVPYGDRYNTSTAVEITGIEAHPTLGAVFAILANGAVISSPTAPAPTTAPVTVAPPAAQASTPQATAQPSEPVLHLSIGSGGLKLAGTHVEVRVSCSGAAARGSVKLVYSHEDKPLHHRRKRLNTVIGHASYSLAEGHAVSVRIRLTAAGLRFLKNARNHRLPVLVEAAVTGGKATSKRTSIHGAAPTKKR